MYSDFLSEVSIFSELSSEELDNLNQYVSLREYPKGSMIILEEEYGDVVFIIKSGTIKITRVNDEGKEVILSLLGKYEIFGEMSIIDGESRSANALAQEKCELLAIKSEDFLSLLKSNFKITFSLFASTIIRL